MRNLIGAALLALTLCQPALAGGALQQAPGATIFVKEGGGFFGVPAPWKFGKAGRDGFWMYELGTNVTSAERIDQLARLQTAAYALKHGFGYFSFAATKHTLMCSSIFTGDAMASPTIDANVTFAKVAKPGLHDAKAVWTELMPILSADASNAEKDETFSLWTSACAPKSPGLQKLFNKQKPESFSVNGVVFAIQR